MAWQRYTCYVVLRHVHRQGQILPGAGVYRDDAPEIEANGWRALVMDGTLSVWRVDRTLVSQAKDLVLAHLAGHAPTGVTLLWDSHNKVVCGHNRWGNSAHCGEMGCSNYVNKHRVAVS